MPKQMHFSRHEPFLLQFSFSSPYFSMWALIPDSSKGQWLSDPTDKHLIQHFEIFPSLLQPISSWPVHHIPHHLLAPLCEQIWHCVDEKSFPTVTQNLLFLLPLVSLSFCSHIPNGIIFLTLYIHLNFSSFCTDLLFGARKVSLATFPNTDSNLESTFEFQPLPLLSKGTLIRAQGFSRRVNLI